MQLPGSKGQPPDGVAEAKARLRVELSAARVARAESPSQTQARTARALSACAGAGVVACYLSRPDEPDTTALISSLTGQGVRVLVPLLRREPDWAWFSGFDQLIPGPYGIPQPGGPALGADALSLADWIWLPGLAATTDGRRLGTGGGWYDQALAQARTGATRGVLLFDREVLDDVPTQSWDQPVDIVVTATETIRVATE